MSHDPHAPQDRGAPSHDSSSLDALHALGWDAGFQAAFDALPQPEGRRPPVPARVIAQHRGRYVVARVDGAGLREESATLAGRLRHAAVSGTALPAVGDWAAVVPTSDGDTALVSLLPRRTAFVRKAAGTGVAAAQVVAANVDVALVVEPLAAGDHQPNARRLERYVALAWESGALPAVVLTKADLSGDPDAALAAAHAAAPGAEALLLSSHTGDGFDALVRLLRPGRTAALLGPSGAGKSTLANRLLGAERLRTRDVRDDGKGRHTTTHRELLRLAGGALLIDTPGMRELALWDAADGVDTAFADVVALAADCRFRDCAHAGEPGCAVLAAAADGRLNPERLTHWRKLRRELAHLERQQDDVARRAEHARVRAIHRSLYTRGWGKYGG